jgi:hypothetical protein
MLSHRLRKVLAKIGLAFGKQDFRNLIQADPSIHAINSHKTYTCTPYVHTRRPGSQQQRDYNIVFDQSDNMWLFYEAVTLLQSRLLAPDHAAHAHMHAANAAQSYGAAVFAKVASECGGWSSRAPCMSLHRSKSLSVCKQMRVLRG